MWNGSVITRIVVLCYLGFPSILVCRERCLGWHFQSVNLHPFCQLLATACLAQLDVHKCPGSQTVASKPCSHLKGKKPHDGKWASQSHIQQMKIIQFSLLYLRDILVTLGEDLLILLPLEPSFFPIFLLRGTMLNGIQDRIYGFKVSVCPACIK